MVGLNDLPEVALVKDWQDGDFFQLCGLGTHHFVAIVETHLGHALQTLMCRHTKHRA